MKRTALLFLISLVFSLGLNAQLNPGDKAVNFELKNVDGKTVSLQDYSEKDGVILVFTCNPCPFAKAYEQRIISIHNRYSQEGWPVVAINPNDDKVSPDDTWDKMKSRAAEKGYPFPYLKDVTQEVYRAYGATRTPHIYLLAKDGDGFKVVYIGAIDNNAMNASAVSERYLESAIQAVMQGRKPNPEKTDAIGCTIKTRS